MLDIHHIPDRDLERYHLGRIDGPELAVVEEHLLLCPKCQVKLSETQRYIEAVRANAIREGVIRA